ncbi:MAG: hypothetical protein ACE5QF_02550 [Thermoplasmata archaeon]
MTPSRRRGDCILGSKQIGRDSYTLHLGTEESSNESRKFPVSCSGHPLLLLLACGGWLGFGKRGKKKRKTEREDENASRLEEGRENGIESGEPAYEMRWKRVTETQTRFISMMIDEAHERYLQSVRPPENVKRLLDRHVKALKEEIVNRLRQGE